MKLFKFSMGDRVRMTADFLSETQFATGHSPGTVMQIVVPDATVILCRVSWDTGPVKSSLINQKHLEALPC